MRQHFIPSREHKLALDQIGVFFETSTPKLPGSMKFPQRYRRMVVYLGKNHPSFLSERSTGILRILIDETAYIGLTDRSYGFRTQEEMKEYADQHQQELAKFKKNPRFVLKRQKHGWSCNLGSVVFGYIWKTESGYKVTSLVSNQEHFRRRKEARTYLIQHFNQFIQPSNIGQ